MPPSAAVAGRMTWEGFDSRPSSTSRLTSRPMSRKKRAIRPSLIHSNKGLAISRAPTWTATGISSRAPYTGESGELLMIRASTAAAISSKPLAASSRKKRVRRLRTGNMLSMSGWARRVRPQASLDAVGRRGGELRKLGGHLLMLSTSLPPAGRLLQRLHHICRGRLAGERGQKPQRRFTARACPVPRPRRCECRRHPLRGYHRHSQRLRPPGTAP